MRYVVLLTLCLFASAGCEKALFSKDLARSPYDRYMVLRGRGTPPTVTNAYGGQEPALRQRLQPLGPR